MIDRVRAAVTGARAAWRSAARLDDDLGGLLAAPTALREDRRATADRLSRLSLRYSRHALRLLAALPGGRWRNTCLYRSAAECLLLRDFGAAARLCLGVRKNAEQTGEGDEHACDIRAHAWVEVADPGRPEYCGRPDDVIELAAPGGKTQGVTE